MSPRGNPPGGVTAGVGPAAAPPKPPFVLSPHEEAQLDRVLQFWEQRSSQIKTFRCKFFRMEYNAAFEDPNRPNQPLHVDKGEICYAAPDKGMFRVEEPRPEHWVCNGKAVYQYDFQQKRVVEHKLPPELQGKGITDGPLPFIFGAKADQIKRRYWMRITTPADAKNQVWLEVLPKFQQDAANFRRVDLILNTENMLPYALQLHDPGGQSRVVYQFPPENTAVNSQNLRTIFEDPFNPRVPRGWKMVSGDVPQVGGQAGPGPAGGPPPAVGNRPGVEPR
jgi:TIGR03009 family protein